MAMLLRQEKPLIPEPFARLDGEREQRGGRSIELEMTHFVPTRFGRIAVAARGRRRASPMKTAPVVGSTATKAISGP